MLFLSLCVLIPSIVLCGPVIRTPFGEVEGIFHTSPDGTTANVFLGMRYANAPDHYQRFEKPHIVDKWEPIRHHATKFRAACIPFHKSYVTEEKFYSEDCLFLNIMTPSGKSAETLPVLVFIHGGGYEVGDSEDYGYERAVSNFVSQGIIVVTIQYRLGPLGFFSTGDSVAPGNLGLWDQTVALQFLHEILPSFGGDVDRITVSGNSAGAASTSALAFSPHAEVFFNQAIEMSGSMFAEFSLSESVVEESSELARVLGCKKEKSKSREVVDCMKEKTMEEILEGVDKIGTTRNHPNIMKFHPRLDEEFFPYDLEMMIKTATPKKTISGLMAHESAIFGLHQDLGTFSGTLIPKERWDNFTRDDVLQFITSAVATEHEYGRKMGPFIELLTEFYLEREAPSKPDSHFYIQRFVDLLSDLQFVIPTLHEIELKRKSGWESYFYVVHHESVNDHKMEYPIKGAWHGSELKYLFNFFGADEKLFDQADKTFQKHFVSSFVNFVKNGNPSTTVLSWPSVTDKSPWIHASFRVTPKLEQVFRPEALQFWLQTVPNTIGIDHLHKSRLPAAKASIVHNEL